MTVQVLTHSVAASGPAVQRAALVNIGELATYDSAKGAILGTGLVGDTLVCHVLASATSGLIASLLSTPMDVAKTRIMNQDPLKPMYRCVSRDKPASGTASVHKNK